MKACTLVRKHLTLLVLTATAVFAVINARAAAITAGWFAPRVDFECAGDPASPVLADFDGDGRLDVVVPVYQANLLVVRQNISVAGVDGVPVVNSRLFGRRINLPAGPNPAHVAVGDLNGDGKPDLVVANDYGGNISVYQNLCTTPGRLDEGCF